MFENPATQLELDSVPRFNLFEGHPSYSWCVAGKVCDHHDKDRLFARNHLETGNPLYQWQYVFRSLTGVASERSTLSIFVGSESLTSRDMGEMSMRRYVAEEMGFKVSNYAIDYDNGVASADISPYDPAELPALPTVADGTWRDWLGTPVNRDEVDRWHSAFLMMSDHDLLKDGQLVDFYKSVVRSALENRTVSAMGMGVDVRLRAAFARKLLILSGCEVGEFATQGPRQGWFSAEVSVLGPKLELALDAQV